MNLHIPTLSLRKDLFVMILNSTVRQALITDHIAHLPRMAVLRSLSYGLVSTVMKLSVLTRISTNKLKNIQYYHFYSST